MSRTRQRILSPDQLAAVARLFGALSEPSRLALLQALYNGPLSVSELMKVCSMRQANVSKHLAILHDQHLVQRRREGLKVLYEIADPVVFSLCELVCGKMECDAEKAAALFQPDI